MEIIDFHCHPFADNSENLCFYKETVCNKSDDILTDMAAAGISRFCGSIIKGNVVRPVEFAGFDVLRSANADALYLRDRFEGKYIPGIQVSPQFVEESIKEIEFAAKNNVKLIGELVPYLHGGYPYFSEEFSLILNEAEKHDMVISLHRMNLDELRKTALRHKHINFVSAHVGEYNDVMKYCEIMKECDNIYIDISAVSVFRAGTIAYLSEKIGADRILFGTDYPIEHPSVCIENVMREKITDSDREKILSKNAKRLLDI